jgi:hypothetical protein
MKIKTVGILIYILLIIITSGTVAQIIETNQQEKLLPNEFLSTIKECDPSIDIEKYVRDRNGLWVDADTENEAVDLTPCIDALFKIVIYNDGDCPFFNITILDTMSDGLTFISSNPDPDNISYDPPYYHMDWFFPGPLMPAEEIEIIITAHVEGPYCSIDFNHALVECECEHDEFVEDDDYAYIHPKRWKVGDTNLKILQFLPNHQKLFLLLSWLFHRLI